MRTRTSRAVGLTPTNAITIPAEPYRPIAQLELTEVQSFQNGQRTTRYNLGKLFLIKDGKRYATGLKVQAKNKEQVQAAVKAMIGVLFLDEFKATP